MGLAVTGLARLSFAEPAVDWEVSGTASVGFTDNVANTAEPAPDDAAATAPEADGFGSISPAARLQIETPTTTQTLTYAFGYNFYFRHSEANAFSNALGYGLRVQASELVETTMSLSFSQSTTSQFNLASSAGSSTATPTAAGNNIILFAGAGLGFSEQLGETLSATQSLSATLGHTVIEDGDDTETVVGGLSFGLAKEFVRDTLAFEQGNELEYTPEQTPATGDPIAARAQVLHRVRGVWGHAFNEEWSSQLGLGIVLGYDAVSGTLPIPQPSGLAALTWRHRMGTVELSYAHDAQPNLLLQEITVDDSGALRAQVELPFGFDITGSGGVRVSRAWLAEQGLGPPTLNVLADAAVGYTPATAPLRLELRYQFSRQQPLESDVDVHGQTIATIMRNTVLLSLTFAWPGAPTAGGAAPFVTVPAPTTNPDILSQAAPRTERALDEERTTEERERREDRERRGGSGSGEP